VATGARQDFALAFGMPKPFGAEAGRAGHSWAFDLSFNAHEFSFEKMLVTLSSADVGVGPY